MNVVLGKEGLLALKTYLETMDATLTNTISKIERKLAEEGFELLKGNAPTYDIDGNITGSISMEKTSDGYRVVYSGEDVAYIEFGTGYKGLTNSYPNVEALGQFDWEYDSNNHGSSGWFYYSKRDGSKQYSRGGMYPEMPVYKSYTQLRDRAKEIIEGVLNDIIKE